MNTVKQKLVDRSLVFLMVLIFAPIIGTAQPASLPPAAQEALGKGILAAKVPDYPLAIRFFEEARKAAPEAPVIYFNLGLAESKIPGRELRAIAWFEAYLLANPNASNAAVVSARITELDVRNQSNLAGFLKTLQGAATQMTGERQSYDLFFTAKYWADSGDISTAIAVAGLIQDPYYKSLAEATIAVVQMRGDDKEGAQKTFASALSDAERTQSPARKSQARAAIIEAQTKSNNADKKLSPLNGQSRVASAVTASDWIKILDVEPMNTAPLLDLAGYLKSLPASNEPQMVFESLRETGDRLVKAQNFVGQMLKGQVFTDARQADPIELQVLREKAGTGISPFNSEPSEKERSAAIENGGEIKFVVEHDRGGAFTIGTIAGVLTISPNGVRFEETEKGAKLSHSFQVSCAEIASVERIDGGLSYANFAINLKSSKRFKLFAGADALKSTVTTKGVDDGVHLILQTISDTCKFQ